MFFSLCGVICVIDKTKWKCEQAQQIQKYIWEIDFTALIIFICITVYLFSLVLSFSNLLENSSKYVSLDSFKKWKFAGSSGVTLQS